jgi:hypothetical protein
MTDRTKKTDPRDQELVASCQCGKVAFVAVGKPIVSAACYCKSCQEAARRFAQLPGAPAILNADGGTDFLLYRKDRVRCERGADLLQEHRLKPDSPTRRMLATCCNSAMFLEMKGGHWLSMYSSRFSVSAPSLEMRVMTRDRPAGVVLGDDVPNFAGHSAKFMWKLLRAWIAMGFRVPELGTTFRASRASSET